MPHPILGHRSHCKSGHCHIKVLLIWSLTQHSNMLKDHRNNGIFTTVWHVLLLLVLIKSNIVFYFYSIGAIPAPILLGSAIDHSCILWDNSTPGSKGTCLMYDNLKLASTFSLFSELTLNYYEVRVHGTVSYNRA